jgi:hypothetical protein
MSIKTVMCDQCHKPIRNIHKRGCYEIDFKFLWIDIMILNTPSHVPFIKQSYTVHLHQGNECLPLFMGEMAKSAIRVAKDDNARYAMMHKRRS